ncbi:MAG: hypothetical protein R3C59_02655 [Planctomycetaceae bacterium]
MQPTTESDNAWRSVLRPSPQESRRLIALVFAGLALRIALLLFRTADLKTDPDAYVAHAETLLQTGGYHVPGTDHPTAFRAPLYPILLAGLKLIGLKTLFAIGTINALSAALLIIATWWLARVVGLRGIYPAIAAVAAGLDPLLLKYSGLPMTEVLTAALLTFAILQILKSRLCEAATDCDQHDQRQSLNSAVSAGFCFGLAGLCRPVTLITCAVLTLAQLWTLIRARIFRQHENVEPPRTARSTLLIMLPAIVAGLVLTPWIIRNAVQFGKFIPATTHGGYTLLLGNNDVFYQEVVLAEGHPVWQRGSLDHWQKQIRNAALNDGVDMADETAVDAWMYQQAFQVIRSQPETFRRACVLRWQRFWAVAPARESEEPGSRWLSMISAIWYSLLWLGLLSGLVSGGLRRLVRQSPQPAQVSTNPGGKPSSGIHLLWLAILSFLLLHSFYWTNARMRAPLMGILCVLAVSGWQLVIKYFHRHESP